MRILFSIALLFSLSALKAQTIMAPGFGGYYPSSIFSTNLYRGDNPASQKWSFNTYSGISSYYSFFRGGNAFVTSAPVSFQLNRRLTNNLYAFGNVTVAPAYVNFNRSFINNGFNKTNPATSLYGTNGLGVYSSASMGLMYMNDERTFSVSGSISVQRGGNPYIPAPATITTRPSHVGAVNNR